MVSSTTRKIISLAISLLVVVISLTGIALGANVPTVTNPVRYTPGFAGDPGKMARDAAGNFYVTDFWGKRIVKLNSQLANPVFIATTGRPSAVAVLADGRLVVAMSKPTAKVAFYSQAGDEISVFASAPYNPTGITVDASGNIYVLDSGDTGNGNSVNYGKVRVYDSTGVYKTVFGARTDIGLDGEYAALGAFKMPMGIAYEKTSTNIVVADTMNSRLQFFKNYNIDPLCSVVKSLGNPAGKSFGYPVDDNTTVVRFGDPTDIAFEYTGSVLDRIYVAERAKGDVVAVDPVSGFSLARVNGTTVANADMKYPAGIAFETTAAGKGVLYVTNAATATPANLLKLSVDSGSVTAPTATMTIAPVPATSPTSPINVSGTVSNGSVVTCKVNGTATGTPGAPGVNWTVTGLVLQSGSNYILCQSATGGASAEAFTYNSAAAAAPTVTITQPAATSYTNNATVTLTGTSDTANATVRLDNSLGGSVTTQTDASMAWSAVVTLVEGSNVITPYVSKLGTATGTAAPVTVIADFTPPNMTGTISFLANNAITNNAIQNLDGIVVDANIATIEVNGAAVQPQAKVVSGTSTYFSIPVTLVRGLNSVTIKATDLAGNSTTITRTPITLKPEIPGMTVALPADNSYMAAPATVTASGTANSAFNAINAAGTAVTPSAGAWSTAAMNATAGFVSYQFTASGSGVDTVTEKRTINTGASFEQVAITSPAADMATNASSVIISGNIPSANPAPQISINGAAAVPVTTYAAGAFSHTVPLASGLNSVKIISSGGTTAVRNILYDTTLPDLTIQADSKPMPTAINGSIEPSATMTAITASLGGTPVAIPLSRISFDTYDQSGSVLWHANLNGYAYDTISFSSLDPAGNSTTLLYKQGIPTGDIDGDGTVRLADALASLRHVAGTQAITDPDKFFSADVGGLINGHAARDGVIDITDSVLILLKAYGLVSF